MVKSCVIIWFKNGFLVSNFIKIIGNFVCRWLKSILIPRWSSRNPYDTYTTLKYAQMWYFVKSRNYLVHDNSLSLRSNFSISIKLMTKPFDTHLIHPKWFIITKKQRELSKNWLCFDFWRLKWVKMTTPLPSSFLWI